MIARPRLLPSTWAQYPAHLGSGFGLTVMAQPLHLLRPPLATPVAENSQITFYPRQMHGAYGTDTRFLVSAH